MSDTASVIKAVADRHERQWGPWCKNCGHPAGYHGVHFCTVMVGGESKRACDCVTYNPATPSEETTP